MARLLISLGANLGNTFETMVSASRLLRDAFGHSQTRFSRLYRTPPVGGPSGQSDFLNAVVHIETSLTSWEVWDAIKRIETDLGRHRQHRWEARRIDMDILLHGESRIWTPHLKIPHPRMCMRSFVLIPALEVADDAIDPVTGWTIDQLRNNLRDAQFRHTQILCNSATTLEALHDACRHSLGATISSLRFATCPNIEGLPTLCSDASSEAALTIVCVQTPEPESIQWEDYSFPWSKAMGLSPTASPSPIHGPRYLLPANDIRWAVHEIEASRMAMTCEVHALDVSWS